MNKRGQVTTFIIIGVAALIIIALILFLRNQAGIFVPKQEFLRGISENIKDSISECTDTYAKDGLNLMLDQGGKINPVNYRLYQGKKVSYLCTNIPGDVRCMNNLDPLSVWEENFNNYLKLNLDSCINLDIFKSSIGAYEIKYDGYDVSSEFMEEGVVVEIKPKISLTKSGEGLSVDSTFRNYDVPIGKLHSSAFDVIEGYAKGGDFYNLQYMISQRGNIEAFVVDKPYPDSIYSINAKDDENKLYFAIEGEEVEVL